MRASPTTGRSANRKRPDDVIGAGRLLFPAAVVLFPVARCRPRLVSRADRRTCKTTLSLARLHTHTHTFNGPFSGTTRVSRYQKGKTNLDFTEARDSEWQWHQLGPYARLHLAPDMYPRQHPTTLFFTGRMPFLLPNQQRQSTDSNTAVAPNSREMFKLRVASSHSLHLHSLLREKLQTTAATTFIFSFNRHSFLPRDASAVYAMALCLSVSVISRCSTKMAKRRIT